MKQSRREYQPTNSLTSAPPKSGSGVEHSKHKHSAIKIVLKCPVCGSALAKVIEVSVEHDMIVCMPPKRRYTVEINIKAIRKGEPKIIESEEILPNGEY